MYDVIMTIDSAIIEWKAKRRQMGCAAASKWFCCRVAGFVPKRLTRFAKSGEVYQHVVATDGRIVIDLAPYSDHPGE